MRGFFAFLSRTCIAVYSRLPIFGYLRASMAVIRKDQLILIIERSDGRGLSFPGGLAFPWEAAEEVMRREVMEETGLLVGKSALLFEYKTATDIPCIVSVFEAEASGGIRESWEGTPRWLEASDIQPSLLPSQKTIIDRIR